MNPIIICLFPVAVQSLTPLKSIVYTRSLMSSIYNNLNREILPDNISFTIYSINTHHYYNLLFSSTLLAVVLLNPIFLNSIFNRKWTSIDNSHYSVFNNKIHAVILIFTIIFFRNVDNAI
jgi:hypothetical protein